MVENQVLLEWQMSEGVSKDGVENLVSWTQC